MRVLQSRTLRRAQDAQVILRIQILKQSGLPRPRIGDPSATPFDKIRTLLRTGMGAASAGDFGSTELLSYFEYTGVHQCRYSSTLPFTTSK